MTMEMIFADLAVSFFSGLLSLVGGLIMLPFLLHYPDYISIKFDAELNPKVIRNGYIVAGISILTACFFTFRIFYIITQGKDFESHDWLSYDFLVGFYMFLNSYFILSLYRERRRIEKLTEDRNDDKLSDFF
jgi:hypothetical protein